MGIRSVCIPFLVAAAAALLLAGCASADERATLERVAELGLDASDPVVLVEQLDALPVSERPDDLSAWVLSDMLMLKLGDREQVELSFADDDFYISIAPYVEQTHYCDLHTMTSCLGELRNTPVEIVVTDANSGEEVRSEQTSTADNGFVGLWLPRERALTVRIESEHGSAEQTVGTFFRAPTCITTMQLR